MEIRYAWRGYVTNQALNALHAEGFGHEPFDDDWETLLDRHSLGWVCAYEGEDLVGFVNVAWDGAFHAFILDTLVSARLQRRGIATQLVLPLPLRPARRAVSGSTLTLNPNCVASTWRPAASGTLRLD